MRTAEKVSFFILFIFVILGPIFSKIDLILYEGFYAKEDSLIEWFTVIGLFLGAVTCFYRVKILMPFRKAPFLISTFLLGVLFLFGLGEEISWGQRLFGFKSSSFFLTYNSQGEMNLHNLVLEGVRINKLIFGTILGIIIGIYFLILPVLYRKIDKVKTFVDSIALPLPKIAHIVAYLILAGICELIEGGKKGEVLEFGGVWIFILMTLSPYNTKIFSRKSFSH